MNIGWVGFHMEGMPALRSVLLHGFPIRAVLILKPEIASRKSGAGDYASLCREFDVPIFEVASINDPVTLELLRCLNLDVVFVIGWTELLRPECLRLGRLGMVGAHASLLPRDRGRAPINWALIRGLETMGNSLIWLSGGVDQGDLIDQTIIPITPYDTCASLYEKVGQSNRDMILRLIPQLLAGARPGTPQTEVDEPPLTRRRPDDGGIDWSMSSRQVYDFVRDLTRPTRAPSAGWMGAAGGSGVVDSSQSWKGQQWLGKSWEAF
jgi:methionyl-tRNA formyltransferase